MIDKQHIIKALSLWFQPGDVFEIRVLDATTADYMRPHVESGYFDFEHIDAVADALAKLRTYRGVYATVNPVNLALLARANNRLRAVGREPTTADADILCRRWLLLDFDAKRPSGVSSTDEEHDNAQLKAMEIQEALAGCGWTEPIMLDSGNGAQLMYRIDLPSADEGLVQKVIQTIAGASDDQVDIDLTVHNPARIWRIPGTMNCKGDSIETRPHRMAKLISAPEKLEVVSEDKLKELVGVAEPVNCQVIIDSSKFNIDSWITQYCPELGQPQEWKGGRRWVFNECPFNSAHNNRSAVLIEQPSGAIAFTCHHNSCQGNDWFKLRELKDPGCYEQQEYPEVNIDGILNQNKLGIGTPVEPEIIMPWRQVKNDDVRQALKGTYLGELVNIYSSVTIPPLPLEAALVKAIVTCACCLSGEATHEELQRRYGGNLGGIALVGADRANVKINTGGGQMCNAYGMIVAPSTSGKDIGQLMSKFSKMQNPYVKCNPDEQVTPDWDLGTGGSAEGVCLALTKKPNGLVNISEMKKWLEPSSWQRGATDFLTEAFSQGCFNQVFSDRGRRGAARKLDYSSPNVIANIQPESFEKWISIDDIHTGLIGRFVMAKMPDFYGNSRNFDSIKLLEQMRTIADVFLKKSGVVEIEEGYSIALQNEFLGNTDPKLNPSWRRLCNEYYPRFMVMLSVNHSVNTQGKSVVISDEVKEKAAILVRWFFAHAERLLIGIEDADPRAKAREALMRKVFIKIKKLDKGGGVTITQISYSGIRNSTGRERREALMELEERGIVQRDGNLYQIIMTPPDWES
jgi:hypothetical protein